jgi:hypothetical protein
MGDEYIENFGLLKNINNLATIIGITAQQNISVAHAGQVPASYKLATIKTFLVPGERSRSKISQLILSLILMHRNAVSSSTNALDSSTFCNY